ncbi:MAG: TIGR04255 family protein [Bacteroidetes bacterium]|nr:MAG: TIGR04255 family protein [Bacteroidota bacterium]
MNSLPTKILPCPIIEATVELRFNSELPKGAVFGVLYNSLKDTFGNVEQLPTAMLPPEVTENDPNFKYKAHYKLTDGVFNAQIGHNVVSFHSPVEYTGWQKFSENIIPFFNKVRESGVVSNSEGLYLRYLNFFELNIYEHINLMISLMNQEHISNNLVMRTELKDSDFTKILQLANNVTLTSSLGQKIGSLMDITCLYNGKDALQSFSTIIAQAHKVEKELFFGLLKPEFLETLNPEYNNG